MRSHRNDIGAAPMCSTRHTKKKSKRKGCTNGAHNNNATYMRLKGI